MKRIFLLALFLAAGCGAVFNKRHALTINALRVQMEAYAVAETHYKFFLNLEERNRSRPSNPLEWNVVEIAEFNEARYRSYWEAAKGDKKVAAYFASRATCQLNHAYDMGKLMVAESNYLGAEEWIIAAKAWWKIREQPGHIGDCEPHPRVLEMLSPLPS